jgi:hypothetical protein
VEPAATTPTASAVTQPTAATQPGAAPDAAARPGPNIGATFDRALGTLQERLTIGELLIGLGAVLVLALAWLLFWLIINDGRARPPDLALVSAAGVLIVLWIQNGVRYDFGAMYRVWLGMLSLVLALLGAVHLIEALRGGGLTGQSAAALLGQLSWWVGGGLAGLGAWMVWREEA